MTTTPKRRWFRFGLRTMFVVVTLVTVAVWSCSTFANDADSWLQRIMYGVVPITLASTAFGVAIGRWKTAAAIGIAFALSLLGLSVLMIWPGEHP